jgi:hypothetical protein
MPENTVLIGAVDRIAEAQRALLRRAPPAPTSADHIEFACNELGMNRAELYIRYYALGGMALPSQFNAYCDGRAVLPARERDLLSLVLHEASLDADRGELGVR